MILLENIGKKEVASAMVFNENNIAKRNKSIQNAKRRKASKEKLLEESIIEKDKIRIINY